MTVDSDCSQKIKRCLLLGRIGMPNLDSVLKSRDITLLTKICTVKAMFCFVFFSSHVLMWEFDQKESWVLKNWCFWIVVLRRLLRVPWRARRSNQPIPMEINPEYSLEGLILKLKLQYFDQLMPRVDKLEKTLMLGKTEGRRRKGHREWDGWMASPTQWTWVWANSRRYWRTGKSGVLQSIGSQWIGHDLAIEQQQHIHVCVCLCQIL